jgi:hypothetical protein
MFDGRGPLLSCREVHEIDTESHGRISEQEFAVAQSRTATAASKDIVRSFLILEQLIETHREPTGEV